MIEPGKGVLPHPLARTDARRREIKMLRILVAVLIPSLVVSSPALSQSFEQFERASQFEKAMAVVDQIRSRKKLQCLISVGNRSLCECLSTRLPFTRLPPPSQPTIANRDRGAADYGRLSAADMQTVDQCVADNH